VPLTSRFWLSQALVRPPPGARAVESVLPSASFWKSKARPAESRILVALQLEIIVAEAEVASSRISIRCLAKEQVKQYESDADWNTAVSRLRT